MKNRSLWNTLGFSLDQVMLITIVVIPIIMPSNKLREKVMNPFLLLKKLLNIFFVLKSATILALGIFIICTITRTCFTHK